MGRRDEMAYSDEDMKDFFGKRCRVTARFGRAVTYVGVVTGYGTTTTMSASGATKTVVISNDKGDDEVGIGAIESIEVSA